MKGWLRQISLVLFCALALTGCASKSKRQQHSYEKYLRKSSVARMKQRSLLRPSKPEMPPSPGASEPIESTETGPTSVGSGGSE